MDKLESVWKKWSPNRVNYLNDCFKIYITKQKVCKECGLVTNKHDKEMFMDLSIRNNNSLHECLEEYCSVETMCDDNKIFCERCDKNCDTDRRTALGHLPNTMVFSLKRFDLDYTTFETVKLNDRVAFDLTLNLKRYTLRGGEAAGEANKNSNSPPSPPPSPSPPQPQPPEPPTDDSDYEYKLVGVLIHAGVAQGGHYYSFIKDRSTDNWFRFDDEDVTAFDICNMEREMFGGKVMKETKVSQ